MTEAAVAACWVLAPPLPPAAAAAGLLTQLVVTHKITKLGICSENIGEDCLWFSLLRIEVVEVLTLVSRVYFNRVPQLPETEPQV